MAIISRNGKPFSSCKDSSSIYCVFYAIMEFPNILLLVRESFKTRIVSWLYCNSAVCCTLFICNVWEDICHFQVSGILVCEAGCILENLDTYLANHGYSLLFASICYMVFCMLDCLTMLNFLAFAEVVYYFVNIFLYILGL